MDIVFGIMMELCLSLIEIHVRYKHLNIELFL